MAIKLYQFPLSHYCEKTRWALDYKKLAYEVVNLLPGPHLLATRKLASKTTVPILVDEDRVIQESADIMTYLDSQYPQQNLTPADESEKQLAIDLEKTFDEQLGMHLRRIFYYYVLPETALAKSIMLHESAFYGTPLYAVIFPLLRRKMQQLLQIDDESMRRSREKFQKAWQDLEARLDGRRFLVGNQFSRADLAAAALLSPLFRPAKHPFPWEKFAFPPAFAEFIESYQQSPVGPWVAELYAAYR